MPIISESPINRLPLGMLGFVDVKSMGKTPSRLGDAVSPILDMRSFYVAGGRRFQNNPGAINVNNVGLFLDPGLRVPSNKAWIIESVSIFAVMAVAGMQLQWTPVVVGPTNEYIAGGELSPVFVTGDQAYGHISFPAGFVATASCAPAIHVSRFAIGPYAPQMTVNLIEVDA